MKRILDSDDPLENKKIKADTALKPDVINYISVSSLESIAVVNMGAALCKESDIINAIWQHFIEYDLFNDHYNLDTRRKNSFNQIEKNIVYNLSLLPLPNLLKAKVSNCIEHIVSQMMKWFIYRKNDEDIDSISWTNEGSIDKKRTLKKLLDKDTNQNIEFFYELACEFCVEESIPILWDKLPDEKKNFYQHNICMYEHYSNHLIAYWTHAVNNQFSELFNKIKPSDEKKIYNRHHTLHKNMFNLALSERNSLAVKYFWYKLNMSYAEISQDLKQWVKDAAYNEDSFDSQSDILFFLLSKVDGKEQQDELFQQYSEFILNSLFADWPRQSFLLLTIRKMWDFLDENVYVDLLNNITLQIREAKTTEKLFSVLWYESPVKFKKYYIQNILFDGSCDTDVFYNLLMVKDIVTIRAILDCADFEEQKTIIFSLIEKDNFVEVIREDRLPQFDILIEMLSESETNCMKKKIVFKYGDQLCTEWIWDDNWIMVEKFLNWVFTSQDEINDFKNKTINKIQITYDLIYYKRNYELVNKFMKWCFVSEKKIIQFKIYFAKSKLDLVEIGSEDWCLFDQFMDWCFDSEQEINNFKCHILQSYELRQVVLSIIACSYNFEFIDKLISWCCHSSEDIKQYKSSFVFTKEWEEILQGFVSNYKILNSDWNNWELIKKLMKLFSPLEADTIAKLKEKIATSIDFDDFYPRFKKLSFRIKKKHLFRLLDNDNYNVGVDESSSESDDTDEENSSESDGSDSDHDSSNFCDKDQSAVLQVLMIP